MTNENDSTDFDSIARFDRISNGGDGRYAIYDAATGAGVVGLYLHRKVFEAAGVDEPWDALGINVEAGEAEGATLHATGDDTKNYVEYENQSGAILTALVHKDIVGADEWPETVTLTINEADIEAYEEQDALPEPSDEDIESVLA